MAHSRLASQLGKLGVRMQSMRLNTRHGT